MLPFYHAQLETDHFTFDAYGKTEADARRIMQRAWSRHRKWTSAAYTWDEIAGDVNVTEVRLGHAYRDGERIWAGSK